MIQLFLEEHWRNIGSRRVFPKVAQEAVISMPTARGFRRLGFLPSSRPSLPSVAGPIREGALNGLCPLTLNAGRPEIARTRRKGPSRLLRLVDPALAESMLQALALKPSHRYFPR